MEPLETPILASLNPLHEAMYNRMKEIDAVAGLAYLGFGSSKTNPALNPRALKISMIQPEIDRERPMPMEANRISVDRGEEIIRHYDGAVYSGREKTHRFPMPMNLTYEIDAWCHSASEQIALDIGILQKFPDRGNLVLMIDGVQRIFPIERIATVDQSDLEENLLSRLYRYRLEAYVESGKPDNEGKIILTSEIAVHEGKTPEDINLPGNNVPLMRVFDEPDEDQEEGA